MRTCPCSLHRLPNHPSTHKPKVGLIGLYGLCWCECDHAPDEERWAATRLAEAEAQVARVRALMVAHQAKDGRVPVCQLRTALDGAR